MQGVDTMRNLAGTLAVLGMLGITSQEHLAAQVATRLEVAGDRPMMKAIDELEARAGIAINYEDPPFENPEDLQDVTAAVQNAAQRAANPAARIIVPRGGTLSFDSPLLAQRIDVNDLRTLLTQLGVSYEASNVTGRFVVARRGSAFFVEPIAVRARSGPLRSVQSVFSTPISMPLQQRSAAECLLWIAGQVTRNTGLQVGIGAVPFAAFANTTVTIGGGSDQPASALLSQLLAQVSATSAGGEQNIALSYRLLFDPGLKYYMLNVHRVEASGAGQGPVTAPPGGSVGQQGFGVRKVRD